MPLSQKKKLDIGVPELVILGNHCTEYSRKINNTQAKKIINWPTPQDITGIHSFLGVMGMVQIFIKDFTKIASPLVHLTLKEVEFDWGPDQEKTFTVLKESASSAPALRPINYKSDQEVILAIDSLNIAAGTILMQIDKNGKRHPA